MIKKTRVCKKRRARTDFLWVKIPVKSPEQKDEAQRKVKKEIPRKWHRKVSQKWSQKWSQKTISENYERKLSPSILSRQNVLTYRNTSYLKMVDMVYKKGKSCYKRYFIVVQQIARHFVHYRECLYHPPSLLCNSNN